MPRGKTRWREVLIATLGTEPQVVTLVLDELLKRRHGIHRVVVVHTDGRYNPIRQSLMQLKEEEHYYKRQRVQFTYEVIRANGRSPRDIETEEDAGAAFRTLYHVTRREKRTGNRVHLSIAGGRKVMAVYGMTVAQLLFDENDCVWHLLSEPLVKKMHADEDDRVILIPVPVLPRIIISPITGDLLLTEDPWLAIKRYREIRETEEWLKLREFVERELTDTERKVLELLVRYGMSNKEIATQLDCREKTVANHISQIIRKCRYHLRIAELNRARIIAKFAPCFRE